MKNIKSHKLEYYKWKDVQQLLCDEMNIPFDCFTRFYLIHYNITTDEYIDNINDYIYMNLWHIWIDWVMGNITNDAILLYFTEVDDEIMEDYIKKYGKWSEPFLKSIKQLEQMGEEIWIKYSW